MSCNTIPDYVLAESLLGKLKAAHWKNEPDKLGMHTYGYTASEQEAIDIVVREAVNKQGMKALSDLAGNIYLIKEGKNGGKKTDVIVSHIDTVEKGGAHDGRDGIAAGIAVVAGLKKAGITPENDLCVMIARSEESCINGQVSIGAKAATGLLTSLDLSKLKNRTTGQTVLKHMKEIGIPVTTLQGRLDPSPSLFPSPTLFPTGEDAKSLIGFLAEAHIEQGNYCAKQNVTLGIVSEIRGNTRFPGTKITGEASHSGATFEEDRADAVRAAVALMHAAETWYLSKKEQGKDIVFTPASINTTNTSPTTIANNATLSFEIRSTNIGLLQEFASFMKKTAVEIEEKNAAKDPHKENKLVIALPTPKITEPAHMDKAVISHAQKIAAGLGIKAGIVTSGAGHDTAMFSNTSTPSVMIFIKQDKPISHNPEEGHNRHSFRQACDLLSGMVTTPCHDLAETIAPSGVASFTEYLKQQGATAYTPGKWQK